MSQHYLGIDVSKAKLDVALWHEQRLTAGSFSNDEAGLTKLLKWLKKHQVKQLHACLEATGRYGEAVALCLHGQGYQVSVVNPRRIKAYADSKLARNKTDQLDAQLIADFCATQKPYLWTPPSAAHRELQALVRHVDALKADLVREQNRLSSGVTASAVCQAITSHIEFLQQQIAQLEQEILDHIDRHPDLKAQSDLLTSVKSIGKTTAAVFLAEVPDVTNFDQTSQIDAFAGLTPRRHESGSSVRGRSHLVKTGNPRLRTAFYMPALNAIRFNPIVRALAERLRKRGKSEMTIIGAAMRKLLNLAYGVLKTGKRFDPNYAVNVQDT